VSAAARPGWRFQLAAAAFHDTQTTDTTRRRASQPPIIWASGPDPPFGRLATARPGLPRQPDQLPRQSPPWPPWTGGCCPDPGVCHHFPPKTYEKARARPPLPPSPPVVALAARAGRRPPSPMSKPGVAAVRRRQLRCSPPLPPAPTRGPSACRRPPPAPPIPPVGPNPPAAAGAAGAIEESAVTRHGPPVSAAFRRQQPVLPPTPPAPRRSRGATRWPPAPPAPPGSAGTARSDPASAADPRRSRRGSRRCHRPPPVPRRG